MTGILHIMTTTTTTSTLAEEENEVDKEELQPCDYRIRIVKVLPFVA
jgi:hypothetical protein